MNQNLNIDCETSDFLLIPERQKREYVYSQHADWSTDTVDVQEAAEKLSAKITYDSVREHYHQTVLDCKDALIKLTFNPLERKASVAVFSHLQATNAGYINKLRELFPAPPSVKPINWMSLSGTTLHTVRAVILVSLAHHHGTTLLRTIQSEPVANWNRY